MNYVNGANYFPIHNIKYFELIFAEMNKTILSMYYGRLLLIYHQ